MDIKSFEKYLNIEHYNTPSIDALNHYIKQFMTHVPFENISVQNKERISLKIEDLYDKIVNQKRGGYCYELNMLFSHYLKEKGFQVDLLSATIHTPNGGRSKEGSHMSILVTLNSNAYIVDVGFGDLPLGAMPITSLNQATPVNDGAEMFRALLLDNIVYVQKLDSEWDTRYETTLEKKELDYFRNNIEYNQTNPNSIFVKKLIITLRKPFGRITMSEDALTITTKGSKEKFPVTSENYRHLLKKYFNLDVMIKRL